ncbi:uncharacterized protein LOC122530395 isoform X3 [Frieseomelitta varia]|uniref:uncharacterized protein LOC122530395 isoform X3 n=1 Tax=Frieseomelitta varia TaxID=561572 RepID=UPI001CB67BE8|nr:uncharacterized protein LOC122530395 isoform X3 [Frieseomelitta varia]
MQNWNQWQLSAGAVATPMPQPPVGYATPGADPMAMMQAYMQYYNQPAPSGYTAEQWAAAQQQNWAQWQQWQQQYQQWQAQYGEKYQETMKHMSAQNMSLNNQVPQLPIVQPPPPLPKEDTKPPLPPTAMNTYQFTSMPPPHQNNLPLFPAKQNASTPTQQTNIQNCPQNPPLPPNQPPLPPENNNSKENNNLNGKRSSNTGSESNSAKKLKVEDEELTEAEKTFDAQFKQWEEQFNKWKQQNANHPDKTQYKQYEAKWTSWREKLIERREQMRRKREQQKQAAKVDVEKNKSLPGDDKILNILSSTENQRLINNLLGIGKTLGLTGKQNTNVPPPPPPPPATETITSNVQTATSSQVSQSSTGQLPVMNMMSSNMMTSSPWNSQQWTSQYNAGVNVSNFPNFQTMTGVPPPPFNMPPTQMPPPNFTQPPPNFPAVPNFSQPPPGFISNDSRQSSNIRPSVPPNMQGRPPPFGMNPSNGPDNNLMHNERQGQLGSMNNFDSVSHQSNFGVNDSVRQKEGMPPERFSSDSMNDQQINQFRNDMFVPRSENYKLNDERVSEADQFRREDRNYQEHGNSQFNQQKINFNDRFTSGNDRFGPGNNRFGPTNDRFGPGDNRFVVGNDRFGPGGDRIGQGNEPVNDRFGLNNELCSPGGDRFNRNNIDRFDQKDVGDNRRDSFPNTPRNFNRNTQFESSDKFAPELKKLMEKRRAAMDVFKPSYLDSDKSSTVGSLSESFKKITGDSLFMKPGGNQNFGTRGSSNFASGVPSNFRMSGDFKLQGSPDFGPRGSPGIVRNNSFDSRDGTGSSFKGPNSSPHVQDFTNTEPRSEIVNIRNDMDVKNEIKNESPIVVEQTAVNSSKATEQNVDNAQKDNSENYSVQKDIPLLEKPPWIDVQLPEDNSLQKDGIKEEEIPSAKYSCSEQNSQNAFKEQTEAKQELSNNNSENIEKKTEVLPFMGENDPKPEDLNMEPPPELPNLGPVLTDTNKTIDSIQRTDESYDAKESSLKPFASNTESFDPRGPFDSPFGPRGMPFRPNVPFLSPRGPNDVRLPMFESPFNSSGPNPYPLGPQGPNDVQFGPRSLNDGQFGPRGPNDGQFGPRGPNDGQFGPRGPNDGQFGLRSHNNTQFGPRGPGDGPFGPRGPGNGQFGPRSVNDGIFGPRGPTDGLFGPRGPADNQFGLRAPNNTQFGSRPLNIGQFDPRYDIQLGLRRPNNGQFGSRSTSDGQFGPQGSNNRSIDNRGPGDSQFIPRGLNEGQSRFSGPNEKLFGSRRNDLSYQRNPTGSKIANDAQFPNRFNEKQFDNSIDGCFGSRGPIGDTVDTSFPSRGQSDRPFDNRQLDVRAIGEFRSKGPIDNNSGPKIPGTSETSGEIFANNEKILIDENIQQRQFDSNDTQNAGWRQPYSKNSFGDIDQRSGRGYSDKSMLTQNESFNQIAANNIERRSPMNGNKCNISDKRSERNMNDMTVGDYKTGYSDPSSGSDYTKFDNSNMYMKRSMDNRQSQIRCPPVKEFCIEKQFNYNHGGAGGDKKFLEHIPVKVIDYAHTSRSSIQDHLTPVQCFDYGHGNLKPLVPEHEMYPTKDFRNWEENEQNLKDYTDRIRRYECYASKTESRRSGDYKQKRNSEEFIDDRKSEREHKEKEDYKMKEHDDRIFDHTSDKDLDNRFEKNSTKERTRERCETSQKETNKENDKDEDRSKGNINWQENSNKNIIDTKPSETSVTDTQHNVLEAAPKTLELAKTSNCTMVDDLLCPPGRQNRPPKIAIILRGPPGSGKSFVAKLIKDKEVEQGGSAPRILSLDDYFLVEKEIESMDDNGKKIIVKEMVYEYEEAMEQSYIASLVKAFKKNITDGFFNFIILDCINEKISDYEEMWSFAKTKGFKVYVCEMEMDLQICLKRNIHNRTEDEINRIIDYFEPTPNYHQKLDVNSMLQEQAIEEVHMEDTEEAQEKSSQQNEDSQDSQDDIQDTIGVSKWERMEAEDKLDRLDGLAKKKNEGKVQTMKDFLQVPDYYNMEDTSGKKRVRWADLEERKEQEKMRAVGFVVGHTNWDRMMDPTKGGSALTRTKFFSLS